MPSDRFKHLRSAVSELRRLLLPKHFDPAGQYKYQDRVRARSISFQILCHAEFESYFEDRAIDIASSALHYSNSNGKINHTGAHLLAFSGVEASLPPASLSPHHKKRGWRGMTNASDRLKDATNIFVRYAQDENHGIKEKNLSRLLLPIGLEPGQIDSTLVSELNSYGSSRGGYAHSSTTKHAQVAINPQDELKRVRRILSLLIPLDAELSKLLV